MLSDKGRQVPDRVLLEQSELVFEGPRVPVQVCEFPVEFPQGEFRWEQGMEEVEEVVVGRYEAVLRLLHEVRSGQGGQHGKTDDIEAK